MTACGYSKLDVVKYLIENPLCSYKDLLTERDNVKGEEYLDTYNPLNLTKYYEQIGRNAFMISCGYSKLELIKYLIENPIFIYKDMLNEKDNVKKH